MSMRKLGLQFLAHLGTAHRTVRNTVLYIIGCGPKISLPPCSNAKRFPSIIFFIVFIIFSKKNGRPRGHLLYYTATIFFGVYIYNEQ